MTRKLTGEELVDATTEELLTYLQSGALNTRALTRSLDYDGLDIDEWDRIKRIHFCLAETVHDFVTALPDRVRRIKTEHQRENLHTRGEVRGSINWSSTLRARSDSGFADRSQFVCNTPYTEYDIPENRVLKRLLWEIHRTVTNDLQDVEYDWRRDTWTDDHVTQFNRVYKRNVHLNRISDGQSISVTAQDMNTARQSRLRLYTRAYDLYDKYQRLQSDTFDTDITDLLGETLIIPSSTPTLFELFCIFRIIRSLTSQDHPFHLTPIDGSSDALAHLTRGDHRIEIHHDSIGSLDFREPIDPATAPPHRTYKRYHDALVDYSDTLDAFTDTDHDPVLYNGRPDLIIERYDTTGPNERLDAVVIGEVKHSDSEQTFKQGLEELLKYRRFARHDDYLIDTRTVSLTSLLITNGYSTSGSSSEVTHLNGADLLRQGRDDRAVDPGRGLLKSIA